MHLRTDELQGRILEPVDVVEHHVHHHISTGVVCKGGNIFHTCPFPSLWIHKQKRRVLPKKFLDSRDMLAKLPEDRMHFHSAFCTLEQVLQLLKRGSILFHKYSARINPRTFLP